MRIAGKDFKQSIIDVVPIFRGDETFYIKVQAVTNMEEFDKYCKRPEPPTVRKKDNTTFQDFEDKKYLKELETYNGYQTDFLFIQSLACNEDMEWELVKMSDPTTWSIWREELAESGLLKAEIGQILEAIFKVNSLDQGKIEEAKKSFLANLRDQQNK